MSLMERTTRGGSRLLATSILGVASLFGCAAPGPSAEAPAPVVEEPAVSPGLPLAPRIYATNQDDASVTVLDASTGEVIETMDLTELGFGPNAKPHHVVAEPDGSFWYVSLIGENRVLKLDARNNLVGQVELEVPGLMALDSDSERLLVGRSMSAVNPPRSIGVVDRDAMTVEEIGVFFPRPHALATHPQLDIAYSASLATNQMAVVDAPEEEVEVIELPVPGGYAHTDHDMAAMGDDMVHTLVQWAVSPDGRTLVGTGEMSRELLVYDLTDPYQPRLTDQVPVEARPWHPVFSPDGRWVWFANKGANAVTVVDTRTWTVADVVRGEGLAEPHGVALSPDGDLVFVSSNDLGDEYPGVGGTVVVIDAETREIVQVHPVGRNPTGVGTRARP